MRAHLAALHAWLRRLRKGRISRDGATARVAALLARLDDPTPYLRRVSRVAVYGSYARGARRVGDVDLAIDYDGGKDMPDRSAINAATDRLADALGAVEAVAPALANSPSQRAENLAADAARLRRQLNGLPATHGMFAPLRQGPAG